MFSLKSLSLLALAGSTIAAPHHKWNRPQQGNVVWETVVKTVVATVEAGYPEATPAPVTTSTPAPRPVRPTSSKSKVVVVTSSKVQAPATSQVQVPATSSKVQVPATSAAAPAPSASAPASGSSGYMATVDEWRAKLGLSALTQDSTLEANALKTAQDGNGQMVHQLLPGTMGQVLAPGDAEDFYHCFVGGWLCERPDMAGMDGVCDTASEGWYYTSTGHADILTSPSYSKIGCGNAGGIWACDLA